MLKRAMDLLVSACCLVLFSPVLLGIALWIKLDSSGPVFYRGTRSGRGNRPFEIFKFRSMYVGADRAGVSSSGDDDARITPSGRFIRRYKLDELSQLINVLLGDMSLVGPRPEVLKYTSAYQGELRRILEIRPGITDWASIWNADEGAVLSGSADPDLAYETLIQPTKLRLQLRYVRERSLRTDVLILACTARRLFDRGFYPRALANVPRLQPARGNQPPVA